MVGIKLFLVATCLAARGNSPRALNAKRGFPKLGRVPSWGVLFIAIWGLFQGPLFSSIPK